MRAWMMSSENSTDQQPLAPWQFFTLAGLAGATITVFITTRGQAPAVVVLLSLTIFAAALVGAAALRTFGPLFGLTRQNASQVLGGRTRAALEREKMLVLRSIKELEFDRAMGKVSEKDFNEMGARLRGRAARILRQLDAAGGYRDQIQKEIDRRLGPAPSAPAAATSTCASCDTANDVDAKFCKNCGAAMGVRA
jgi:hypothetical protein